MPKIAVAPRPADEDMTSDALASWTLTARWCLVLLAERAGPVLAAVAWMVIRR